MLPRTGSSSLSRHRFRWAFLAVNALEYRFVDSEVQRLVLESIFQIAKMYIRCRNFEYFSLLSDGHLLQNGVIKHVFLVKVASVQALSPQEVRAAIEILLAQEGSFLSLKLLSTDFRSQILVEAPGDRVTVHLVFVKARNRDLPRGVPFVARLPPARQLVVT